MTVYPVPEDADLVEIYRRAITARLNDERVIREMLNGQLFQTFPTYYSTRGQEIIPAAVMMSLNDDDYLCTTYRGAHDLISKGFPLKEMWAELAGRATGSCKGKGGGMRLTDPASGSLVTTGVVGGSIPIATGLGWAAKLNGRGQVSLASFGDGACNIGAFHESLNFAAVFELPVVFLCQNNLYAKFTSMKRSTKVERYSERAAGYGIEGVTVNGNSPDEIFGAARWAIDRARAGEGPTFIEAMTYRFNGHLVGDACQYMPAAEVRDYQSKDPVPILRQRIIDQGIADLATIVSMEAAVSSRIDAAVDAACAAPFPRLDELECDVFAHSGS